MNKVTFDAYFDTHRQVYAGNGDGSCRIILTANETDMAETLKAFAFMRDKLLKVSITVKGERIEEKDGLQTENKNPPKERKTYR